MNNERNGLYHGRAEDLLPTFPTNSIDALITDPPSAIHFMGLAWDANKGGRTQWVAWLSSVLAECLRVMKPGAHGLIWALPRTSHWTACAAEDAGFEIIHIIHHIRGEGMPKGINISKSIDKLLGAERIPQGAYKYASRKGGMHVNDYSGPWGDRTILQETLAGSEEAAKWEGWHSQLKPSVEHWILCRKPIKESSLTRQVLATGTGGLNIGACRIGTAADMNPRDFDDSRRTAPTYSGILTGGKEGQYRASSGAVPDGRFPADLVLSHAEECTDEACVEGCPIATLDAQAGMVSRYFTRLPYEEEDLFHYFPKASPKERDAGLGELRKLPVASCGQFAGDGRGRQTEHTPASNNHPTVKSLALMRWLVKLITPPDGVVLDCFAGSGSTLVAAQREGFSFIGIEESDTQERPYYRIAQARLAAEKEKNSASNPSTVA